MSTKQTEINGPAAVMWDSDSIPIRIDNCCTKSLSDDINDFDTNTLMDIDDKYVSGFVTGSKTPINKIGTIRWNILVDEVVTRQISIHKSYLVTGGTSKLLSPQHWV
jgi:hypothetical protein